MTEREEADQDLHPAAALLPEYVTGRLSEEECRQVSEHLADCPTCRRELEEVTWLRGAVSAAYAELPGPSPGLFHRVMDRIEAEDRRSWWKHADAGLRRLFAMPWAPVLATGLIVAQTAGLLWLVATRGPEQPGRSEREVAAGLSPVVTERSVPSFGTRVRVAYEPAVPEREIRRVLNEVNGRIVDGPLPSGAYVVELPVSDPAQVAKLLKDLASQTGIVRVAEVAVP